MLCLGALTGLTGAYILSYVELLPNPKGEAADEGPGLGPAEMSSQRSVMTFAEHLRAQATTGRDAQSVGRSLAAPVQQTAAHEEPAALRRARVEHHHVPLAVDELSEGSRCATHDWTEQTVRRQRSG